MNYTEIMAEILNIFRPLIYLLMLLFQRKRKSYKAYIAFIVMDLLRIGLQKPAENQI
jgi:hypothetical protein